MKVVPMKAERRTAMGRNQLAHIRNEGWMPAVLYGQGGDSVAISISEWELDQHVKANCKVFALDVAGATENAFLQEVAWHTLNDRPLHADFRRIDLDKPLLAKVEVSMLGHAAGLSKGGTLVKDQLVVEVRCLPSAIPEGIEVDVSKLNIDDFLRAKDLPLPEGVELVSSPDTAICHVVGPRGGRKKDQEAPAEGDAAAEGDKPAAGGDS
ncbi:MAG: 50S ribosomal protein L25 [bacterium]|nr:50S ribosomal protein L25 [bacterium]